MILYVIGKAVEAVNIKREGTILTTEVKKLSVTAIHALKEHEAEAYEKALNHIEEQKQNNRSAEIIWLRHHTIHCNFYGWQLESLDQQAAKKITFNIQKASLDKDTAEDISTALKFKATLNRLSKRMTKIAKEKNNTFTWLSLNPQKAQEVKR